MKRLLFLSTWVILFVWVKSTVLEAQTLSAPIHLYGLWNDIHPFELTLDSELKGQVHFTESGDRIALQGRETLLGWDLLEILPEGSSSGTWHLSHIDKGKVARWSNYNKSVGATCILEDRPISVPDLQVKLFQFRSKDGDWYFFLFPAPPAKWRGIAWSNIHPTPLKVIGSRQDKYLNLDIYDPEDDKSFKLHFEHERPFPRFGWWTAETGIPEKIRFRHKKGVPVQVRKYLDYYREMLVLEPEIEWPSWIAFASEHLSKAQEDFRKEWQEYKKASVEFKPYQRQSARLYAWVTWSFIRSDLLSGTLHIANSWGAPVQAPFLVTPAISRVPSLADLWAPDPVPRWIQDQVQEVPFADKPNITMPMLELRPDGLYIWQDQPVHIATAQLKGTLPKESPLYPYFGK